MRKTKIVCTIGPASEQLETMKELIRSGLNIARLNFSHGNHDEHAKRIETIRQAAKDLNTTVGILLDTKGPEIRTGLIVQESVELIQGNTIILTTEEIQGDDKRVSITYAQLPQDVHIGSTILIDDGLIGLRVKQIEESEIHCEIVNGGTLKSRKGVNVPGVRINLPGITDKDEEDIRFGIKHGVDFIAASFVRKADDVLEIRRILDEVGADIHIISKIENREGVDNLDSILEVSDGLMVARGDLGVEIPPEEVPLVQKDMIRKCNLVGKPVITATQMLDSMIRNPRPTRAEASDVANAIFDGTDCVMLSGETAAGKYPLEAVQTMARIAVSAESALPYREILRKQSQAQQTKITDAIGQAVAYTAFDLNASAIITSTEGGYTARIVSKYRPRVPIIAVTPNEAVMRKLAMHWGVIPVKGIETTTTDEMFDIAVNSALSSGHVRHGDLVVITAGVPVGQSGTTNLMKVHVIGDIIARGQGIGRQVATGKVISGRTSDEIMDKMKPGAIIVSFGTEREMMPAFEKAAAVITVEGGLTSHAAIVGINLGIPVIVGVDSAMELLEDGMIITVDAERGHIYSGTINVI